jgi:hypothetical protein
MHKASGIILVLCGIIGLSACQPVTTATLELPTATYITPSPTASPSPIWFPPTQTPTPPGPSQVASTPTSPASLEAGALIFSDDFSDPAAWELGQTGTGSRALGKNELTLAIAQPHSSLSSLRRDTQLGDYLLEITASPSLCKDGDEYGLLLRVTPEGDFYRWSLTCDGQTRLDKYYQGKASSPQGLMLSGAVPPGAPSQSRLAVRMKGKVLDFYINGEYQFSVRDPSLVSGTIGVYARAAGDNAVTVNFSDLSVYEPSP